MESLFKSVLKIETISLDHQLPYLIPDTFRSSGSGFLINGGDGIVVTNSHVVENLKTGLKFKQTVLPGISPLPSRRISSPSTPMSLLSTPSISSNSPILSNSFISSSPVKIPESNVIQNNLTGYLPQFGRMRIPLTVLYLCPDSDLAICQIIDPEVLEKVNQSTSGLEIADSIIINIGQEIIALGYPLGEDNIKMTTGVVSGFTHLQTSCNKYDCRLERDRAYSRIQISAPISPGNSGGPLLYQGKVIGVNSSGNASFSAQNINYAVPSRLIYNTFSNILANPLDQSNQFNQIIGKRLLFRPNFSLRWNIIYPEWLEYRYNISGFQIEGIRISNIFPDSFVKEVLKIDDILTELIFDDIFYPGKNIHCKINNRGEVQIQTDQYGQLNRFFGFSEAIDLIPFNSTVTILFFRDGQEYQTNLVYSHSSLAPQVEFFPSWEPFIYRIFAGILLYKHIDMSLYSKPRSSYKTGSKSLDPPNSDIPDRIVNPDVRDYVNRIYLREVFPNTFVHDREICLGMRGLEILETLNGLPIKTFEDLDQAIMQLRQQQVEYYLLMTNTKRAILIPRILAEKDDQNLKEEYHLDD